VASATASEFTQPHDEQVRAAGVIWNIVHGRQVSTNAIDALPSTWPILGKALAKRRVEERAGSLRRWLGGRPSQEADELQAALEEAERLKLHQHARADPGDDARPVTIAADQVEEKPVEWLWHGRIPLGKLTLLAGENDLGKTLVLCDLAARITQGVGFPDQCGIENPPGSVIFISGEDDIADTLCPRLRWAGAKLKRVRFFPPEVLGRWSLTDLDTLTRALGESDTPRAIIIDPSTAFCGGIDDHKTTQLRSVLTPLVAFAAEHNVAVVLVTHTGKAQYQKAGDKILGSVGWRNVARAAWMFFADPDDDKRRLILRIKGNLSEDVGGLAYRIVRTDDEQGVRVEWESSTIKDRADDVLVRQRQQGAASENDVERAAEWLRSELAHGPKPSAGLPEKGKAALGLDRQMCWWRDRVLKAILAGRAERARGVVNPPWYWCLPGQGAPTLAPGEEVEEAEEAEEAAGQEPTSSTPTDRHATTDGEEAGDQHHPIASTPSTPSTSSISCHGDGAEVEKQQHATADRHQRLVGLVKGVLGRDSLPLSTIKSRASGQGFTRSEIEEFVERYCTGEDGLYRVPSDWLA
jgi:hypothetical protein